VRSEVNKRGSTDSWEGERNERDQREEALWLREQEEKKGRNDVVTSYYTVKKF